jgi:hypothetical protein
MNLVRRRKHLGSGQLFAVYPGAINAAEILDHGLVAISENTAMFTANILLGEHNLVTHFLCHATDNDLVALRSESPLRTLIVSNDNADHKFNPKC